MRLFSIFATIFIFIMPPSIAHAITLGMYAKPQKKACDCMKGEPEVGLSAHSFETDIVCKVQCENGSEQESTISRTMNPAEENLKPGDGYAETVPLFASFASILGTWANRACRSEAVKKCGSIEKVTSSRFLKITSGGWSSDLKLSCSSNAKLIESPYEKSSALNMTKNKTPSLVLPENQILMNTGDFIKPAEYTTTTCQHQIKAHVCYGDCVIQPESPRITWPITLQTNDPPVFDEEERICGDTLYSQLKKSNLSKSIAQDLCEEFFYDSARKLRLNGTTCAAYRGTVDCSAVLNSIYLPVN